MKPKSGSAGNLLPNFKQNENRRIQKPSCNYSSSSEDRLPGLALILIYLALIILLSLSDIITSYAQQPDAGLQPGDSIPSQLWNHPLQLSGSTKKNSSIPLSQYSGKLIILDFWATWCSSCISAMPRIHNLQRQYADSLIVLPVSYEPAGKVEAFLKTNALLRPLHLFSVVEDTILSRYFTHRIVPHYVWISPAGKVLAVSSSEYVTATNISRALNNIPPGYALKKDLDTGKPLFLDSSIPAGVSLRQYSCFLRGKIDGLPSVMTKRTSGGKICGVSFSNLPLIAMYNSMGYQFIPGFNRKRLLIETGEADTLMQFKTHLKDDDYFTFDYQDPGFTPQKLYRQLNAATGYSGRIEKRLITCLELRLTGSGNKLKSRGGESRNRLLDEKESILVNSPMASLVSRLNDPNIPCPLVIDSTGYTGNIDLRLKARPNDWPSIVSELKSYGLKFTPVKREMDMLVISRTPSFLSTDL